MIDGYLQYGSELDAGPSYAHDLVNMETITAGIENQTVGKKPQMS